MNESEMKEHWRLLEIVETLQCVLNDAHPMNRPAIRREIVRADAAVRAFEKPFRESEI